MTVIKGVSFLRNCGAASMESLTGNLVLSTQLIILNKTLSFVITCITGDDVTLRSCSSFQRHVQ